MIKEQVNHLYGTWSKGKNQVRRDNKKIGCFRTLTPGVPRRALRSHCISDVSVELEWF